MPINQHYTLNESSGTNAPDTSGNNYNGTLTNMEDPGDWVAGHINNCLQFDGSDEWVDFSNITYDTSNGISIEAWINTTDEGSIQTIYGGRLSPTTYMLLRTNNKKLEFVIGDGTEYAHYKTDNDVITSGSWYHIVVTRTNSNLPIFYVDNAVKANSVDITSGSTDFPSVALPCAMGRDGNASSHYYAGKIDETVVYDYILTAEAVAARWNGGTGTETIALVPSSKDDDVSITEDVTVVIDDTVFIDVNDDVSMTEDVTIGVTQAISVDDDISIAENVALDIPLNISVADVVNITENVVDTESVTLAVVDSVNITEGVTVSTGDIEINVNDSIAIEDTYIAPPRFIDSDTSFISKSIAILPW